MLPLLMSLLAILTSTVIYMYRKQILFIYRTFNPPELKIAAVPGQNDKENKKLAGMMLGREIYRRMNKNTTSNIGELLNHKDELAILRTNQIITQLKNHSTQRFTLREIYLFNQLPTRDEMLELLNALWSCRSVQYLDLRDAQLLTHQWEWIAKYIEHNINLKTLDFRGSNLRLATWTDKQFSDIILANKSITHCQLDSNKISNEASQFKSKLQERADARLPKLKSMSSSVLKTGRLLGEGGFGKVFYGTMESSNFTKPREVAIKMLRNNWDNQLVVFLREAKIQSKLKHPNIVSVLGYCHEGGHRIIMEYGDRSLYDALQDKTTNYKGVQQQKIAKDMAKGLAHMHAEDIIHRDFKSLNVMITKEITAKIADFGLARSGNDSRIQTLSGDGMLGTILWNAPEIFYNPSAHESYSTKSDIYSYGLVLFELMTGEMPYHTGNRPLNPYEFRRIVTNPKLRDISTKLPIPNTSPKNIKNLLRWCTLRKRAVRPEMESVVSILSDNKEVSDLMDKQTKLYLRICEERDREEILSAKRDDNKNKGQKNCVIQ